MTPNQFKHWLLRAAPGESVVYFVGDLSWTRFRECEARVEGFLSGNQLPQCPTNDLAKFIFGYSGQLTSASDIYAQPGKPAVRLVQRRLGPSSYEYIAVRTRHPLPLRMAA